MQAEDVAQLITDRMRSQFQTLDRAAEQIRRLIKNDELVKAAMDIIQRRIGSVEDLRDPTTVSRHRFVPWYEGPREQDHFWPLLKGYLIAEKGWDANTTISSLDDASTKIISQLPCPAEPRFSSRGLVLGYVQSGKTANFTAVISKAADVGFRLVIVLSGLTNSLRQQTQERMEADLIARDPQRWFSWTSGYQDIGDIPIKGEALLSQAAICNLAIVKKNPQRLRRLVKMISETSEHVLKSCPVLIIDDECDQASVNSARLANDRTTINKLLIELLGMLPKVAYVGYTATPYANVLVDPNLPEDLYPRDFIIDLPRPPAYFGAERLFGRHQLETDVDDEGADDGLDMIRLISSDEESMLRPSRAEKDSWALPLTPSVQEALRYFLMASAARRVRGDGSKPSAMLIHTTYYAQPHQNSKAPIKSFVDGLLGQLCRGDPALREELRGQWESEVDAVPAAEFGREPVAFEAVLEQLPDTLAATRYFVENGQSDQRIEPYDGPAIVIGGNILARGLTIEGLVCSLFVRTTTLYDSLMQMGRWFGYRTRYEDLPRVWMPAEMSSYFRDLATVEHEIRQDIARYSEDGSVTPMDVGVRVRLHPRMEVTSKLKQRSGMIEGHRAFDGRVLQTIRFATNDKAWLERNLEAGDALVRAAEVAVGAPTKPHKTAYLFNDVPWEIVRTFLGAYQIHSTHADFSASEVTKYVQQQNAFDELTKWNIGVVRSQSRGAHIYASFGSLSDIPMVRRSALETLNDGGKNIGALLTRSHATLDFDLGFAEPSETWNDIKAARGPATQVGCKPAVTNPLLLLYLIDRTSGPAAQGNKKRHALEAVADVLGVGFVFPRTEHPVPVEYIVAPVGMNLGEDEFDLEELGLEDDVED